MYPARLDLHGEQDVQALEKHGVNVAKVARHNASGLAGQELPPNRTGPARLTVRKRTATAGTFFRAGTVRYEYVVTDTGPTTLHNVVMVDSNVGHIVCRKTTLAPRQSTVCHGTYRITDIEASAHHVTNFAQADGIDSREDIFLSHFVTLTIQLGKPIPVTD